jgi:hypothetical protein
MPSKIEGALYVLTRTAARYRVGKSRYKLVVCACGKHMPIVSKRTAPRTCFKQNDCTKFKDGPARFAFEQALGFDWLYIWLSGCVMPIKWPSMCGGGHKVQACLRFQSVARRDYDEHYLRKCLRANRVPTGFTREARSC